MATTLRSTTLAEFLADPGAWDRIEVFNGVAAEDDGVGIEHGGVAFEFGRLVGNHVAERELGRLFSSDTRYVLQSDPLRVVAPDFSLVLSERLPARSEWGRPFLIPPDLAVEILSAHSSTARTREKVRYYLDAKVPLVLLVDIRRQVVIAQTSDGGRREYKIGDVLDGGPVLPDLRIPVADIFR
jgi:Uma2 family endonuclease